MTKSQLFKTAHKMARNTVLVVGNYMSAFSLALKEVYNTMKETTQQALEKLGCKVWGEKYGKPRIYINTEHLNDVFGLSLRFYKTGNIRSASLNGEGISNSAARRLTSNKIYFDITTQKFVGTTMMPII